MPAGAARSPSRISPLSRSPISARTHQLVSPNSPARLGWRSIQSTPSPAGQVVKAPGTRPWAASDPLLLMSPPADIGSRPGTPVKRSEQVCIDAYPIRTQRRGTARGHARPDRDALGVWSRRGRHRPSEHARPAHPRRAVRRMPPSGAPRCGTASVSRRRTHSCAGAHVISRHIRPTGGVSDVRRFRRDPRNGHPSGACRAAAPARLAWSSLCLTIEPTRRARRRDRGVRRCLGAAGASRSMKTRLPQRLAVMSDIPTRLRASGRNSSRSLAGSYRRA